MAVALPEAPRVGQRLVLERRLFRGNDLKSGRGMESARRASRASHKHKTRGKKKEEEKKKKKKKK